VAFIGHDAECNLDSRAVKGSAAFDVVVIGGGIVGLATARALALTSARVIVLEKEEKVAAHQTGHNSGVIHSGLYYKPGSLKATTCTRGLTLMVRFCEERGVPFDRCGKIVVATRAEEVPRLDELERRGRANGLEGIRRLAREEITDHEPHAAGVAALFVPATGIVDYTRVAEEYAKDVARADGEVVTGARALEVSRDGGEIVVESTKGTHRARFLVNCAGLHSDRVARMCGAEPSVRIVPFRGEYYELVPERASLVKNLIYPVPNPEFPFLGVHFTRMIGGGVEAGPNAVLALRREGYTKTSFDFADAAATLSFGGFWRMAAKYWRTGAGEVWRSWNKRAFARALAALVPEVREEDLRPAGAGVRAQALAANGALVDDFSVVESDRMVHVLNAPSPAATASIAIGENIAARVTAQTN
jgi:L-2-hydroxyglutarate oxidase LhgO